MQSQQLSNKKLIETVTQTTFDYHTEITRLHCQFSGTTLTNISFKACRRSTKPTKTNKHEKTLITALKNYFNKQPENFATISITLHGTPFQQRVWKALQAIPYGQTRTYQQLAKQLNTSARAIGNACRANPIPIIVPCHRIVAKSGLGGFMGQVSGQALKIKQFLLTLEQTI